MMMKTDPITPPTELVEKWINMFEFHLDAVVLTEVAQWGADRELEACCEWLECNYNYPKAGNPLRVARRPKPPSLKERALHELNDIYNRDMIEDSTYDTIRRALEALDD